ncbi:MAG: PIG-L family deacetylase [Gammaproteobacteria bacterium]|nr:MAG: PIG-L family deacetylase [Gammaproteobacteria bacterium]
MDNKNTLYIGAHADDVVINASITIHRNPGNAYILTVTDGAPPATYPREFERITLNSHEAYVQQRLKEDKAAMHVLGINVGKRYTNSQIPDRQTYQNIKQIVEIIATLVKREEIGRIMTHSFPGDSHAAHPDHEIVSVCSYIVGQKYGIEVLEYPRVKSNSADKQTDTIFLVEDRMETVKCDFTLDEATLRDELVRIYLTQGFIVEKYRTTREIFGRVVRNPKVIPDTTHLYGGADYKPTPQDIRKAIADFHD